MITTDEIREMSVFDLPCAASSWQKYTLDYSDISNGELYLFSLIPIGGNRIYFVGYLSRYNGIIYIRESEGISYEYTEQLFLYFARINKIEND